MLKPLKLKSNSECEVFWISDLHVGHSKNFILEPRGFMSVQHGKDEIIANWNSRVSNNDIVFHLGDICFEQDGEKHLYDLFWDLNFKELYLMPGNHHSGFKQLYNAQPVKILDEFARIKAESPHIPEGKTVYIINNYYEAFVNGQAIVMSHYPIMSWNGMGGFSWMIHGHVHGQINGSLPDVYDCGKMLDVGIESITGPISFEEVREIMSKKQFILVDGHDARTQNPF